MKIEKILSEEIEPTIETDVYVPITIEFNGNDSCDGQLVYFHFINDDHSFVEFKVNTISGKIFSAIVVSINKLFMKLPEEFKKIDEIPFSKGNPIVSIKHWQGETRFLEKSNFSFFYEDEKTYMIPLEVKDIKKRVIMKNLELLLNSEGKVVGSIFSKIKLHDEIIRS